jgi:hypothetical protein
MKREILIGLLFLTIFGALMQLSYLIPEGWWFDMLGRVFLAGCIFTAIALSWNKNK